MGGTAHLFYGGGGWLWSVTMALNMEGTAWNSISTEKKMLSEFLWAIALLEYIWAVSDARWVNQTAESLPLFFFSLKYSMMQLMGKGK